MFEYILCVSYRYSSARKLVKLDSVQFILENHTVSRVNGILYTPTV